MTKKNDLEIEKKEQRKARAAELGRQAEENGQQDYKVFVEQEEQELDILEHRKHKDSQIKLEALILIIILAVACVVLFCWQHQLTDQLDEAKRVISTLDSQIAEYKENDAAAKSSAAEQQEKIQLLSDTLSSKTEQLTAYQDAESALRVPNGYPVKGSATVISGGLLDDGQEYADEDVQKILQEYEDSAAEEAEEGNIEGNIEENIEGTDTVIEPNLLFMVSDGTCITATGTGKIAEIRVSEDGLKYLRIDHENGYESIYKCIGNVLVNEGESVSSGAVLMSVTEDASYFEYQIKYEDNLIDPKNLMVING